MPRSKCRHCLVPIKVKDGRRRNKKYCSDRCRAAAFRERRYMKKVMI